MSKVANIRRGSYSIPESLVAKEIMVNWREVWFAQTLSYMRVLGFDSQPSYCSKESYHCVNMAIISSPVLLLYKLLVVLKIFKLSHYISIVFFSYIAGLILIFIYYLVSCVVNIFFLSFSQQWKLFIVIESPLQYPILIFLSGLMFQHKEYRRFVLTNLLAISFQFTLWCVSHEC